MLTSPSGCRVKPASRGFENPSHNAAVSCLTRPDLIASWPLRPGGLGYVQNFGLKAEAVVCERLFELPVTRAPQAPVAHLEPGATPHEPHRNVSQLSRLAETHLDHQPLPHSLRPRPHLGQTLGQTRAKSRRGRIAMGGGG